MSLHGARRQNRNGTESEAGTCAVAPAGNSKTVEDIIGNRTYLNNYVFYAREYTTSEVERQENYDFLDAFFEWLEDNNDNEVYPVISGYTVGGFLPQMCCCLMWMRTGAAPIRFRYS